ncbi:DNA repair protein RadC [Sporosarcina sp. BP05]|uniref:RadC family protein n=1 Tax=Sporosarcina sp. BP05 TaxID=2758726 RepID=UPI001645CE8B|nr:DNA repair protein RadC [Sporosarcina sp. BP05]
MEKVYEIVSIKQVVRECDFAITTVRSPEDAAHAIQKEISDEDREIFLVLCLNTKNEVVAIHRASVGSINSAIVHPREIFKAAILNNSASIICAHNHPSQNPTPSPEDLEVTKRLVSAGEILGIEVLDHIIVGGMKHVSLKDKGYM